MELNRVSERACPPGIIAVAINGQSKEPHCGILYTSMAGVVQICDMQFEHQLGVRLPPAHYFWTTVRLEPEEVFQVAEFLEFVIEQHLQHPLPYSFVYSYNGFDVTGQIRSGVGVTCATFIINIFDRLGFDLVVPSTWKSRPRQDAAFRARIIRYASEIGNFQLAQRLSAEVMAFRIKPWEVYGSATHSRYPVRFRQATKFAKTVGKLVHNRRR